MFDSYFKSYFGPVKPQGRIGTGHAKPSAAPPASVNPDDPLNDLERETEDVL
jgi:hypothetical protein